MEETELRIGNLVYPFDDINLVDNKTISRDCIIVEYYDLKDTSFLEPVLLTEEWLIRFGFDLDGAQVNGSYYRKEFNYSGGFRDYLSITDKGAGYMFGLTSNYGKQSVLPFHYEHVHQLQNLYYALTGKELTIN